MFQFDPIGGGCLEHCSIIKLCLASVGTVFLLMSGVCSGYGTVAGRHLPHLCHPCSRMCILTLESPSG